MQKLFNQTPPPMHKCTFINNHTCASQTSDTELTSRHNRLLCPHGDVVNINLLDIEEEDHLDPHLEGETPHEGHAEEEYLPNEIPSIEGYQFDILGESDIEDDDNLIHLNMFQVMASIDTEDQPNEVEICHEILTLDKNEAETDTDLILQVSPSTKIDFEDNDDEHNTNKMSRLMNTRG